MVHACLSSTPEPHLAAHHSPHIKHSDARLARAVLGHHRGGAEHGHPVPAAAHVLKSEAQLLQVLLLNGMIGKQRRGRSGVGGRRFRTVSTRAEAGGSTCGS